MREDLDGFAAEDERRHTAASMRRHQDEIAAFRLRSINDGPIWMFMLQMKRLALHACRLRCSGCLGQNARSICRDLLFVPRLSIFDHIDRKNLKWKSDRQHSEFGLDLPGQSDTFRNGLIGQWRSIGWYQDMFVHL